MHLYPRLFEIPKDKVRPVAFAHAADFDPDFFDYRDVCWSNLLELYEFSQGFPQLDFEKVQALLDINGEWEMEVMDPQVEEEASRVEKQLRQRRDFTPTEISSLMEDFRCTMRSCGLENSILNATAKVRSNLALWIPVTEESIPQQGVSGCDIQSSEWKRFARFFHKHFLPDHIDEKRPAEWKSPAFWLEEFAANASYGGEPGIVLPIQGNDFQKWRDLRDTGKFIRSKGVCSPEVGVLTFGNGAGHLETLPMDLAHYRLPREDGIRAGIINNMIDSVFGLCAFSSVPIEQSTRWTSNLWFPLKPQKALEAASAVA